MVAVNSVSTILPGLGRLPAAWGGSSMGDDEYSKMYLAQLLGGKGVRGIGDTSPVQASSQGYAQLVNAMMTGMALNRARSASEQNRKALVDAMFGPNKDNKPAQTPSPVKTPPQSAAIWSGPQGGIPNFDQSGMPDGVTQIAPVSPAPPVDIKPAQQPMPNIGAMGGGILGGDAGMQVPSGGAPVAPPVPMPSPDIGIPGIQGMAPSAPAVEMGLSAATGNAPPPQMPGPSMFQTASMPMGIAGLPQGADAGPAPAVNLPPGDIGNSIASVSQATGMPVKDIMAMARIESGMKPDARTGSYGGLYQLDTRKYGNDVYDPSKAANIFSSELTDNIKNFKNRFGREPTGSELYMMHQQGAAGAAAHMTNPDAPAWKNFQNASGWSDAMAKRAIWGNIPDDLKAQYGSVDNVRSGDFLNLWQSKYNRFAGGAAPQNTQLASLSTDLPMPGPAAGLPPAVPPTAQPYQAAQLSTMSPLAAPLDLPAAPMAGQMPPQPQMPASPQTAQAPARTTPSIPPQVEMQIRTLMGSNDKAARDLGMKIWLQYQNPVDQYSPIMQNGQIAGQRSSLTGEVKPYPQVDTTTLREYNTYVQQSKAAGKPAMSLFDYEVAMKKAGSSSVNVNTGENAYDKEMGQLFAKRYSSITDAGDKAFSTLGSIGQLRQAMADPNFYSGTGAETFALPIKQLTVALGGDPNSAASMENFRAVSSKAALDGMGGSLGTGFSNADRDFIVNQYPALGNTPEGNKARLYGLEKIERRKIDVARMAQDYVNSHGRLDAGFDRALTEWRNNNPVFSDSEREQFKNLSASPAQQTPQNDPLGLRR